MSKHTSGPWTWWETHPFEVRKFDRFICRTTPWDFDDADDRAQAIADARLIAAAPDLLDGLKQAVGQLRDLYILSTTPLDGAAALLRKLDAIVAKAEGES